MTTFIKNIPEDAFGPLIEELTRDPIPVNHDRAQAGKGRSQAFGVIRRWSYRPFLARNTWMRPHLYQMLLDFAECNLPPDFTWDGITVNDNYQSAMHRDKGNEAMSMTVSFGNFTGGELAILDGRPGGGQREYDTRHKLYSFHGCRDVHWTTPFEGRRFCLVFYKIVWPPKFPKYKITCHKEPDGLLIDDPYDNSIVVLDRKGHVVRIVRPPEPREWIGRLTSRGQPSRANGFSA